MAFSIPSTGTLVIARTGATVTAGTAGATVTGGQAVYLDSNDTKWKLAQADGTTAEAGLNGRGIALHGSADGQPLDVITGGDWYAGAAAVVGDDYYASDTPGGLDDRATADANVGGIRTLICTGLISGDFRMIGSYTGATVQA